MPIVEKLKTTKCEDAEPFSSEQSVTVFSHLRRPSEKASQSTDSQGGRKLQATGLARVGEGRAPLLNQRDSDLPHRLTAASVTVGWNFFLLVVAHRSVA